MTVHAPCKINIGLDILRRRSDGYHDISTVMYPVEGLYDVLEVDIIPSAGMKFSQSGIGVDCSAEDNICVRAYRLMQERYGVGGVSVSLDKRVPFGAGLGGGSSDATAVIMAVDKLFSLGLSEAELIACAAELGSDTAFFVRNTPQYCTSRGEIMTPFGIDLSGMQLVIIKPDDTVSTREAFSGVTPSIPSEPLTDRLRRNIETWQGCVTNDFEAHIFRAHPSIAAAKRRLLEAGAVYASMSGSGSAVYGLFAGDEKGEKLSRLSPFVFRL